MAGDGFPGVEWIPAHADRFTVHESRTIEKIVLHGTDGRAIDARTTARNVFGQPKQWNAAGHHVDRQSAHYIVGRDGTVVQCVRHKDVAYHANEASSRTIGIEHNARVTDTKLTGAQYMASARLVVWIGQRCGVPMDRKYILGHSEIDRITTHEQCPQRVLDWDTYMLAISEVQNDRADRPRAFPMRLWGVDD